MNIIFYLSIIYICFVVTGLIANIFFNISIDKKYIYAILSIFVLSLGIIAYFTEPAISDDLSRHYEEMGRMRLYGFKYVKNEAVYKINFLINFIFYIISLTNNNYLLPFFSIIIIYALFFYTEIQICNKYSINMKIFALYIMLYFALTPIRFSLSNIRIILAYSIVFLAMYREYFENKIDYITILLYVLPIFIHSAVIIILALRIASIRKINIYKIRYLLLFWFLSSKFIVICLNKIPIEFFKDLGFRLNLYMDFSTFGIDLRLFVVQIIFLISIYILNTIILNNYSRNRYENIVPYIEFLQIVILFTIGSFGIPVIFTRLGYFIALLILPTIFFGYEMCCNMFKNGHRFIVWPSLVIIIGLIAHQAVNAIVYWRFWI